MLYDQWDQFKQFAAYLQSIEVNEDATTADDDDEQSPEKTQPKKQRKSKRKGEVAAKKKVKKKKDIHALSMKPPMGLRPDDVTPEIGTRFVKMFIPLAWNAVKDKSMKKTMKSLRTLFQESKDEGAFKVSKASQEKKVQSPVIAAKTPSAPIASTVPEKQLKEMMNQGFSQHSSEMWYSAFEMLDPSGKGSIDETCLSTFFSQFGEKLEQGEAEFILSKLKRSRGKKVEEKDEEKKKKLLFYKITTQQQCVERSIRSSIQYTHTY